MILLRRPVRLFDVDVLGAIVVAALGAGAYLAAVVPSRAQAIQRAQLLDEAQTVSAAISAVKEQLHGFEQVTTELQAVVARRVADSPTCSEVNSIVNGIMSEAEKAHLQVASVEPQSLERGDDNYTCEVTIVGRGRQPCVVAFLYYLADRHPYHEIDLLTLIRQPKDQRGMCRFELRLRLHLLPNEVRFAKGTPQ